MFYSCGSSEKTEEVSESTSAESNIVQLNEEQFQYAEIQEGQLLQEQMDRSIKANGHLKLPPENKAYVSPLFSGRIRSVDVHIGTDVKKGQLLATLENPDFIVLQEDYLTTLNEVDVLKKEFERQEKLLEDNVVSQKKFEAAKSEYERSKIQLEGIESRLSLLQVSISKLKEGKIQPYIPIYSPISGQVEKINANMGRYVQLDETLFEVINDQHIHLELTVFEQNLSGLKVGTSVDFTTTALPGEVFEARVSSIGKELNEESMGLIVHAELDDVQDKLAAGMYINATIQLDSSMVFSLPSEAIVSEEGEQYVFIAEGSSEGSHTYRKTKVSKGDEVNNRSAVSFEDEKLLSATFVLKGAYYLLAEMNKETE